MFYSACRHVRSVVSGLVLAALASTAWSAPVSIGTFTGNTVVFENVTETPSTLTTLLTPPDPAVSVNPRDTLTFVPYAYTNNVFTSSTTSQELSYQSKSSLLSLKLVALPGYHLESFDVALLGTFAMQMPFPVSEAGIMGAGTFTAFVSAVVGDPDFRSTNVSRSFGITAVDSSGNTLDSTNGFVKDIGPGQVMGSWGGSYLVNASDFSLPSGHQITEITLQYTTDVGAWSSLGTSRITVTEASIGVTAQPVPEPPTIILAGLGAAAAVGHGYRRRKLRQRDAEGSDGEWTAEEGAIALTA